MIQHSPPIALHCVQQGSETTLISLSGSKHRVEKLLEVLPRYRIWKVEGDTNGTSNERVVSLRAPGELAYRDIGGLVFEAQHLKLAIKVTTTSSHCPKQENEK